MHLYEGVANEEDDLYMCCQLLILKPRKLLIIRISSLKNIEN